MNLQPLAERPSSDADLACRIAQHDERAFESMMRRHNRMLYRIARSILKDDVEAEDALQEAYLAAYRNIGTFRGGAALSTWLARIVINESYARLRKQKRAGVVVSFDADLRGAQRMSDSGMEGSGMDHDGHAQASNELPDVAAMRTELRQLLERRIDELPAQLRTVFMLREVEELSVEEAAACLDIPAATVRTRAFRARALLRESLARDIDGVTPDAFAFDGQRCDRIVAAVLDHLRIKGPI